MVPIAKNRHSPKWRGRRACRKHRQRAQLVNLEGSALAPRNPGGLGAEILVLSLSMHVTSWPKSAMHAPETRPT